MRKNREPKIERERREDKDDYKRVVFALEELVKNADAKKTSAVADSKFNKRFVWPLQKKSYGISVCTLIVTFLGVIAAFFAGFFAFGQLTVLKGQQNAMLRQLDAAKDATTSANRAWLYPENLSIEFVERSNPDGVPVTMIYISGDTQNVGHEPARNVFFGGQDSVSGDIVPVAYDDNGQIIIPQLKIDACLRKTVSTEYTSTIYPSQQLPYQRYDRTDGITKDEIDAIRSGKNIYYWSDCVTYTTFNVSHMSSFCSYLFLNKFDNKLQTAHCVYGNDGD